MNQSDPENMELISFINRNINLLNDENLLVRKKAISQIYEKITEEKLNLIAVVSQQVMVQFHKAILKSFSDPIEKIRETAIKILKELLSRCEDMTPFLPYILAVLSERVNCHDLEGILSLPEVMRPPPSQKPQVLIKLIEHSEEIRLELSELISIIISCCSEEIIVNYLDDICNILRALAMDPFYEVQKAACKNISEFSRSFRPILLHFSEILARSLLLPLVSKKSKVKIAAMEALGQVLQCGVYKYNVNVMEIMIGFRDPNSVPIKDFYEPSNKINYFALLINDPKASVREMFIRSIGDWIINLEDRFDHYPRLIPYLLSGLFDPMEEIQKIAYEVIEECGLMLEKEREKEFRDQKQYGVESEWTLSGALVNLPLPHPFRKRPRFGSRIFIRSHVRKFFTALYKELKDWKTENREKAANLMLLAIIYSEDYITQFLYQCIPPLLESAIAKEKEEIPVAEKICLSLTLVGRYCDFKSFFPIIKSSLLGEYSENQDNFRCGLKTLECLIIGSLEATLKSKGLGNKMDFVIDCLALLNLPSILKCFATMNGHEAVQLVESLLFWIKERASPQETRKILLDHSKKIIDLTFNLAFITCLERPLKLLTSFDESISDEILNTFTKFQIFHLITEIADFSSLKIFDIINEYASEYLSNEMLLADHDNFIHLMISVWANFLWFDLEHDVSSEMISLCRIAGAMASPDLSDFLLKISLILIRKLMKVASEKDNLKYSKLPSYFVNLASLFTVPLEWLAFTQAKIKENYLKVFFNNFHDFGVTFFNENLQNSVLLFEKQPKTFSSIVFSSMALLKIFKAQKSELMTVYSAIFRGIATFLKTNKKKEEFYYEDKHQKHFLLPFAIDFFFDQFESISLPNPKIIKIIMEILLELVNCLPNSINELYKGDEVNYKDYDALFNRFLKLTVDSTDVDCKQGLIKCLKVMCLKTPMNYRIHTQAADYNKQFSRLELLIRLGN